MVRLLILCEYPTLLGGERSLLSTLSAVREAGCDVQIAGPPQGPLAEAIRRVEVPLIAWTRREGLPRLIDQVQPDLVHANSLSTARISGPVCAAAGLPSMGHLRDIVKLSQQAVADLNLHRCLIAVSKATRSFHTAQGIDPAKCLALHNGVDLAALRPQPATGYLHAELGIPHGTPLVATVGQLGLRKGTDVALAVARRVPGVHWLVVGERSSEKEESRNFERRLHELASEPGLAGRVHFLGTRDDVPLLLTECTLLVHAARQEPLGRVLLEAAACGLPVVATEVGGTREIFPTESAGAVLVPVDDPEAMAAAANALLADPPRRQTLAVAGRSRAETAFDVRSAARKLIDLYHYVLKL